MISKAKPRVWLILSAAVFAYFVTIIERSCMGVASLAASARFEIGAAQLSALAVTQLAVYAALQIPVGLILDRLGARKLIIGGSLLTGVGNLVVAFTPVFALAIVGRMVVGCGDAFIFVSMIRLINGWVTGPRATKFTQLFANIGQLGQIASAVPFAWLLGAEGWKPAFSAAAGLALLAAALGTLLIRDERPQTSTISPALPFGRQLRENLADPYTRKAFWLHFTMQSSGSVFILLWGYPFLIQGEGLSRALASMLMGSFVFIGFLVGPVLSRLCIAYPKRRNRIVTTMYVLIISAWATVLITPGPNPLWQLILLVLIIGSGGPASMAAFDYSRTEIPKYRLGSSNGVINSGGFIATFTCMFLIGGALDIIKSAAILPGAALYSLQAFKIALPVHLLVITFGLWMFYRQRRIIAARKE